MLYQQGQRIEVIVKKEGGGVAGLNEVDVDNITSSSSSSNNSNRMSDIRKRRLVKTNLTHGFAAIHQMTDLAVNYRIGGIGYENGDQAQQDNIKRTVEKVQDMTNIASSIAMGVAYGSWGGPIGAGFGALFGAVTSISSYTTKIKNRERDYDYKVFKENNAIEYNKARAGINLTSGRLR